MPIPDSAFQKPEFTVLRERYPMSYDPKDRFPDYYDIRSYRGSDGFPQPGYNPNHNRKSPQKVPLYTDNYTILPY